MAKLIVGFTGSRKGMTKAQAEVFTNIFSTGNNYITEFHHGLCEGSDAQAHDLVRARAFWNCSIVGHPPSHQTHYAPRRCDKRFTPAPYLVRNRVIVNCTAYLIATPSGPEITRSGTWSTVRYARKQKKSILIIMPDGQIIKENSDGNYRLD